MTSGWSECHQQTFSRKMVDSGQTVRPWSPGPPYKSWPQLGWWVIKLKSCKNNIFFSLEEAHSSERKLDLSLKIYFCYGENYLIQWNKQNEKSTSTYWLCVISYCSRDVSCNMSDISVIILLTCMYQFQTSKVTNYNLKLHFMDLPWTNLLMILEMSISHRSSCSMLIRVRLFNLFWPMVLLISFLIVFSLKNEWSLLHLVTMSDK